MAFKDPQDDLTVESLTTAGGDGAHIVVSDDQVTFETGQVDQVAPGFMKVQQEAIADFAQLHIEGPYFPEYSDTPNPETPGAVITLGGYRNVAGYTGRTFIYQGADDIDSYGERYSAGHENYADYDLVLGNGWTVHPANLQPKARRLPYGLVKFSGRIQNLTANANAGIVLQTVLPPHLRPAQAEDFALKSNGDASTVCWMQVTAGGNLSILGNVAGAKTWLSLTQISYMSNTNL